MKRKIIRILCSYIVLSAVLCGCADVPSSKESGGISYAEEENDHGVENIIDEAEKGNETVVAAGPFQRDLGSGDSRFHIDATIKETDLSNVGILSAVPYGDMFDKEMVLEVFFAGEADVLDVTEQVNKEAETEEAKAPEGGERAVTVRMEATNRLCLETKDQNKQFARSDDATFSFSDQRKVMEDKQLLQGDYLVLADNDLDGYSVEAAELDLRNMFQELGMEDIEVISCVSYSNEKYGYYDIHFTPVVRGIPIMYNPYERNTDQIVDVIGSAEMDAEEVWDIQANNCMWKVVDEKQVACISLETAVKILEWYIENGNISCSDAIVYDRCELQYMPETQDWENVTLTPVWRFYVSLDEQEHIDMDEVYSNNISLDISINAVNGEIAYRR